MDEPEPGEVRLNEVTIDDGIVIPGEENGPEGQRASGSCMDCVCSSCMLGIIIGVIVFAYYRAFNG